MYNKPKGFRSSLRGGASQRFSKPSNGGRFSGGRSNFNSGNSNFRNHSRPKSKLANSDPNIFVKKAVEEATQINYVSQNKFQNLPIADVLKQNIAQRGYITPTPIQDQAILPILQGRDLIGLANTGTGKTAAFLIPLINKIYANRSEKVLIVVPTRELAMQISDEFRNFTLGMSIYCAILIGGANIQRQIRDLKRNPNVVIATPGRLKDMINRKIVNLRNFSNIVLDEVDLMVDIGFIQDVKLFISLLPQQRQSLFFSATISPKVRELLNNFVVNPVTVSVAVQATAENIDQDIVKVVTKERKVDQLHDLLIKDGFDKVLIFGRTKHGIEKLHKELTFRGFKAEAIHGNKKQGHRQRALDSFKNNRAQILLATDIASRGLDIDNVTHVINYDLPETYEDYIHRIGRTGRANKRGTALTFID